MATPTFVNAGTGSNTAFGTSPTPSYPATPKTGNLALLFTYVKGDSGGTLTPPADWTQLNTGAIGTDNAKVFYKRLIGTETGTITVTTGGTAGRRAAWILQFTGDGGSWFFEDSDVATAAASTTINDNDVTTTTRDRLAINLIGYSTRQTVQEDYAGETGGTWVPSAFYDGGNNPTLSCETALMAAAGTVGGGSDTTITSSAVIVFGFAIFASDQYYRQPVVRPPKQYRHPVRTLRQGDAHVAGGAALTLTADAGTVVVAGATADLKYQRLPLTSTAGTVVVNGAVADLKYQRSALTATAGAVVVAGATADLRYQRLPLTASAGTVVINGAVADLKYQRLPLTAAAGTVVINGADATLTYVPAGEFILTAEPGTVVVAGGTAGVTVGHKVDAAAGTVVITGADATLTYVPVGVFTLTADAGTVVVAGASATLTYQPLAGAAVSEGARGGGGGWPWRTRRWWDDDEEPEPYTWPWERQEKRPAPPAEEPEKPPAPLPPDELVAKIERHRAVVAAAKLLVQQRMHDIDVAGEELLLLEAAMRKLNEDEAIAILMLDEI